MKDIFYEEVELPGSVVKFIKNKEVAHEIAYIEGTFGRDHALAREYELRQLSETGYLPSESKIFAFNKRLTEKYPNAFAPKVGEDGRLYHLLKPNSGIGPKYTFTGVVLSNEGMFVIEPEDRRLRSYHEQLNKIELNPETIRSLKYKAANTGRTLDEEGLIFNASDLDRNDIQKEFHVRVHLIDPFKEAVSLTDLSRRLKELFTKVNELYGAQKEEESPTTISIEEALDRF